MSVQASLQQFRVLADLISSSVDNIEKACVAHNHPYPSPNEPFDPASESILMLPEVQQAAGVLEAAASQLIASVRSPVATVMYHALQYHVSSCLRIAIESHVPEILRSVGPQGLHVKDIAAPTNINADKLARALRVLAIHHVFLEVSPCTFANNRISSCLDTGKDVDDILADPEAKNDDTFGLVALVGHCLDENFKSSAYLQEVVCDPTITNSGDPSKTSLNKAFNTELPQFEWFEQPQNAHRLRRFGIAMQGVNNVFQGYVTTGFDWAALPQGAAVVDIGGGVGSQSLTLARAFSHLKFVVQDREAVVTDAAVKFWEENMPEALPSGRVVLQAHNFFNPQPVHNPAVFLLRMILHDWSDEYCLTILRQLRAAAGPDTQLVVVDNIMAYACPDSKIANQTGIPGATVSPPPAPLLSNYGMASAIAYLSDIQMLCTLNATERTLQQFDQLFRNSGWKIDRVSLPPSGLVGQNAKIIGVPAPLDVDYKLVKR